MELAAMCFGQDPGWRRRFLPCHPVTAAYRCRIIGDFCVEFGVPRQMKAGAPCGKPPARGNSLTAREAAPPAPDQAQGGVQPRPAWPIGGPCSLAGPGLSHPASPQAALIKKAKFTGGKLGMLS